MWSPLFLAIPLVIILPRWSVLANPQINLGYATYEGTTLGNGVNQFLGMRYAAPPLGENRFKRPVDPVDETGVIPANESGAVCLGVQGLLFGSAPVNLSEDCLFVDVYAPEIKNTTCKENGGLPVMLWLQGGAFVQLFNPNYNGTGLIEASNGEVIVVSFNYRVGPYGFLASEELRAEGNLNLGIHDQRFAMAWVQKHISKFGGDPNKVTLFGTSIGGGSVLLQTMAYGGNPPAEDMALWTTGIAGAVYMPSVYEVSDLEFEYEGILKATNCTDLACLRSLDSIQAANIGRAFPGLESIPLFPYGPVIDDALFTDHPQAMLQAGNFSRNKNLIIGSSLSEGTLFAPQANTSEDVASFLRTQYPALTDLDLTQAASLYSSIAPTYPGVTVEEAPFYFQAAQMYGDLAFSCPALEFARGLSAGRVPVHFFRDNIVDPVELAAGYIVPHTWEVPAVWGPEYATDYVALPGADSYDIGGANHAIVDVVQKYWISFVLTGGNPNTLREAASPLWPLYGSNSRLKLQTNATAVEDVTQIELERCAFWRGIASRTRI